LEDVRGEALEILKQILKRRERELFNKTVELLMVGEKERAKIYANEVAFVRGLIKQIEKIE
jgi:division protein CdvB (Snf7/Vps24/ESCRT-III family)